MGFGFGTDAVILATYPFVLLTAAAVAVSFWKWWHKTKARQDMRILIFGISVLNAAVVVEKLFGVGTRTGAIDRETFSLWWIIAPINLTIAFAACLHFHAYLKTRYSRVCTDRQWVGAGLAALLFYPLFVAILW